MIKKVKLGEVADLSIGFVGTVTTQYENGGIPFLRTLNVKPYKIIDNDLKRITKEFHESQKKSKLMEGDVAMVHTGVPGICCVIPEEYNNSNCIDMIVIKPHKDKINAHYLAAYMNTVGYKHIEKQQVGCIQKHFNLKDAEELEIFLPDIETQNKIGEMVNNINNKIENNNAINAELESMAKTIYDYWFLQFEFPNEDGKPYKSSGGKMVWNEELKREIPEGWEVSDLSKLCDFNNGINYDKEELGDKDYKIVNVRNISSTTLLLDKSDLDTICLKSNQADKYLVENDDILIARSGTPGAVRLLESDVNDIIYCGFIIRCKPKNKEQRYYLTYSLKLLEGSNATKTGGSILQNVSQETLKQISVCIPPNEIVEKYNESINDILRKMQNVIEENRELTSLRDFLIPMLMNGQVGFKNK